MFWKLLEHQWQSYNCHKLTEFSQRKKPLIQNGHLEA